MILMVTFGIISALKAFYAEMLLFCLKVLPPALSHIKENHIKVQLLTKEP